MIEPLPYVMLREMERRLEKAKKDLRDAIKFLGDSSRDDTTMYDGFLEDTIKRLIHAGQFVHLRDAIKSAEAWDRANRFGRIVALLEAQMEAKRHETAMRKISGHVVKRPRREIAG